MNKLFSDLESAGIMAESRLLFSFCQVMILTSIEMAELPDNRQLDYRYIDSFVKLIIIMLRKYQFNKHEFMSKIFEFIAEALANDHKAKGAAFN